MVTNFEVKLWCKGGYIENIMDIFFVNKNIPNSKKYNQYRKDISEFMLIAAEHGHFNIVKYFIKIGADIYYKNGMVLYYVSRSGDLETVKFLLQNDSSFFSVVAVRIAIANNHIDILKLFLEQIRKGKDINIHNGIYLITAIKSENLEAVKLLFENGADLNINNKIALEWAEHYNFKDIIKFLTENG